MARESTIGSKFFLETSPPLGGGPLEGATFGATTVIEMTALAGTAVGDIVRITGTGNEVLDRRTGHRVSAINGTATPPTITLDTDTSGITEAPPTTGNVERIRYQELMLAEFGLDSPAPNEVDVTTMRDLERRNVPGLSNTGSATFGGPMDLNDDGIQLLIAAHADGRARSMTWTTRGGQMGLLYGAVTSFTGGPQGVEQAVSFSGTFQVQDTPIYLPAMA